MDLKDFVRALARRWYLTIAIVLVAGGAGAGLFKLTPPHYTAVTSAVLVPPESTVSNAVKTSIYAPPNPLLYLGGLTTSRDILDRKLNSDEIAAAIAKQFPAASYEATNDPSSASPLVVITVKGTSPDQTMGAMKAATDQVPAQLAAIQKELGISDDNRITSLVLTADDKPLVDHKSQLQGSVLGAGGVALAGFLLLGLLDNFVTSRRRGKGADVADETAVDGAVQDDTPGTTPDVEDDRGDGPEGAARPESTARTAQAPEPVQLPVQVPVAVGRPSEPLVEVPRREPALSGSGRAAG